MYGGTPEVLFHGLLSEICSMWGARKYFKERILAWSEKYGEVFTFWMGEKPVVVLGSHEIVREALISKRNSFGGRPPCNMGKELNFVHAILAAREEAIAQDKNDAVYLTERNMVQIALNLFEAGLNTSVSAANWLLLEIVRDPAIQKKVQREIDTLIVAFHADSNSESDANNVYSTLKGHVSMANKSSVSDTIHKVAHAIFCRWRVGTVGGVSGDHRREGANKGGVGAAGADSRCARVRDGTLIAIQKPHGLSAAHTANCMLRKGFCALNTMIICDADFWILDVNPCFPWSCHVGGVLIPKNAILIYNIFKAGRDPSLWEDPGSFRPERFLDDDTGEMHKEKGDHDIIFEDANPTWRALRKVALAAVRFEVNSTDFVQLANINRGLPDMSPLQSDIAPWLGFFQWRLERAFRRHMNDLLALFSRLYDKAKADYVQGKELNFVHAILAAREEAIAQDKNDAVYLTERNMIQIALNLFEAGLNTSVSAASWLLLEIVCDPAVQKKVQSEIDTIIGDCSLPDSVCRILDNGPKYSFETGCPASPASWPWQGKQPFAQTSEKGIELPAML
ncbi:hypothetical protein MTO96_015415 [Rhipicephalus appendiculatus]